MIQHGANDEIAQNFCVDGIVTLGDAKHFFPRLHAAEKQDTYKNEVLAQITVTDDILLNKVDLVEDTALASVEAFIRNRNPDARLVESTSANVDVESLFGLSASHSVDKVELPSKLHDPAIDQTMLLVSGRRIDRDKVLAFVRQGAKALQVYRVKGVLAAADGDRKIAVQGVGCDVNVADGRAWDAHEARDSRLMFVGKDMRQQGDRLQSEFEKMIV